MGISRKLLKASPSQNLMNFQIECNKNSKETAHGQPNPQYINFQLECNRNFKEAAQSQLKSESHRFSFRIELEYEGMLYGLIVWFASLAPKKPKL